MVALAATAASAKEYPIGKPKTQAGLEVAAVYLQPVTMDPDGACDIKDADIHLEADIKATKAQQERLRRRRLGSLPRSSPTS